MISEILYRSIVRLYASRSRLVREVGRYLNLIRRGTAYFYDPVITITVNGRAMRMPLSHNLPIIQAIYPHYDTTVGRFTRFLTGGHAGLRMVDVGANIGGTVAQVSGPDLGGCICIEVDDSLFPILKENISGLPGVIAVRALCSDSEGNSEVVIRREDGSSTVSLCEGSCNSIPTVTVDGLLSEFADFGSPDLIKIDVEGYDYAVLKGTAKTMDKDRPALFFELYPEKLKAAGEDPLSISQFLMEHGYTAALVYDKYGIPLLALDIDDMGTLSGLVDYALLSIDYYDVLAVHSSMTAGLKEFAGLERVYFGLDGGS